MNGAAIDQMEMPRDRSHSVHRLALFDMVSQSARKEKTPAAHLSPPDRPDDGGFFGNIPRSPPFPDNDLHIRKGTEDETHRPAEFLSGHRRRHRAEGSLRPVRRIFAAKPEGYALCPRRRAEPDAGPAERLGYR